MHKVLASLLVTLLTLPTSAFAQAVDRSQHPANGSLIFAAFSGVTSPALSLTLSPVGAPRQIPAKSQNWAARHPALLGALIGMAAESQVARQGFVLRLTYVEKHRTTAVQKVSGTELPLVRE